MRTACAEMFYSMLNFEVITTCRTAKQTTIGAMSQIIYIGPHIPTRPAFPSFFQVTTSLSRFVGFRADTALRQLINKVMRLCRSLLLLIVVMTTFSFAES